jgi:hypothetical protein
VNAGYCGPVLPALGDITPDKRKCRMDDTHGFYKLSYPYSYPYPYPYPCICICICICAG